MAISIRSCPLLPIPVSVNEDLTQLNSQGSVDQLNLPIHSSWRIETSHQEGTRRPDELGQGHVRVGSGRMDVSMSGSGAE